MSVRFISESIVIFNSSKFTLNLKFSRGIMSIGIVKSSLYGLVIDITFCQGMNAAIALDLVCDATTHAATVFDFNDACFGQLQPFS